MLSIKNYFQHTAGSVKKIGLAMRVLVGSLAGSSFIQSNIKAAFYCLLAGAVLDFVLQCLPPDEPAKPAQQVPPNSGILTVAMAMVFALILNSCTVVKPQVDRKKTDTTITSYKQVDISVKGAKVFAGINIDSLYHAALMTKDMRMEDSVTRLNEELQYKRDSIADLKSHKPVPPRPAPIPSVPQKQYITDPQTKAQLTYWIDAYGKFQITCESKDQVIHSLQAQVTKLTKDTTVTVKVVPITPVWNKVVMILEGIFLIVAVLIIVFKSIL